MSKESGYGSKCLSLMAPDNNSIIWFGHQQSGSSFIVISKSGTKSKKHIYFVIPERDNMKERQKYSVELAMHSWSSIGVWQTLYLLHLSSEAALQLELSGRSHITIIICGIGITAWRGGKDGSGFYWSAHCQLQCIMHWWIFSGRAEQMSSNKYSQAISTIGGGEKNVEEICDLCSDHILLMSTLFPSYAGTGLSFDDGLNLTSY